MCVICPARLLVIVLLITAVSNAAAGTCINFDVDSCKKVCGSVSGYFDYEWLMNGRLPKGTVDGKTVSVCQCKHGNGPTTTTTEYWGGASNCPPEGTVNAHCLAAMNNANDGNWRAKVVTQNDSTGPCTELYTFAERFSWVGRENKILTADEWKPKQDGKNKLCSCPSSNTNEIMSTMILNDVCKYWRADERALISWQVEHVNQLKLSDWHGTLAENCSFASKFSLILTIIAGVLVSAFR